MRITSPVAVVALVAGTALMAACSNGLTGTQSALPGNSTQSQSHRIAADHTGVAPRFLQTLKFGQASHVSPMGGKLKDLAVSDFGTGAVEILNGQYQYQSSITNGLNGPDGDWYDKHGNLYVANYAGPNVTEYDKNGNLIFTYSSGLGDPVGVTTDKAGNVYAADYGSGGASVVVEFPQGSNTASASCNTGLANEGVVVSKTGAVFVSGNNPNTGQGNIIEYASGLSGCNGTTLSVTLGFAGGMQMDKHKNLVVCDQFVGVDIIPPPYNTISSTITGAYDPFHVALNKKNKLIFIADPSGARVLVDDYPSGTPVTTLGAGNGLNDPAGVATYPYAK